MNKLKDLTNSDLIRIFNMLKEYSEYLEVEKNKLEEQQNDRKATKTN